MRPHRKRLVGQLAEQFLDLPAEEREAFLEETCGGDAELRAEVVARVEHADAGASAGGGSPHGCSKTVTDPRHPTEPRHTDAVNRDVGRKIADFHIKQVIASGGMGTVYLAFQEHPRRRVALKLMNAGIISRSALRRFEYESQILARLRHPNIAQVYESGTHDDGEGGVPYFAMEYVPNAKPITEYAESRNLSTRKRLELFTKICDAVHHGHQKGIIHRDLKPANLLVDSDGEPRIIDFGVARATDSDMAVTTLQTDVGQLIGTLQYMSPEQCEADPDDLDTRSDVYALGVVLFELLCGRLPYNVTGVALFEATRLIREAPPTRPSTVDAKLRGDIETITLKAMEKDRNRRYRSAAELGDDIRHYLDDRPIQASPPRALHRLQMVVRRHKALAAAAGTVFGILVVSTVVMSFLLVRALDAERVADRQASITKAVNDFLNRDLLAAADPVNAPGRDATVGSVLDAASERIEGRFVDEPLVEAEVRMTLATTYGNLGEYDRSMEHLKEALRIRLDALGEEDPETLSAIGNLGELYYLIGRYEDAEPLFVKTLEIRRRMLGSEHRETLAAMDDLAVLCTQLGRFEKAEPLFRTAMVRGRRVFGEEEASVVTTMANLAWMYTRQGRFDEAEPLLVKARDIRLRTRGREDAHTLHSMQTLGELYWKQGRIDEAEALFRETLALRGELLGAAHPKTLNTLNGLAAIYVDAERYADAERAIVPVLEEIRGDPHANWQQGITLRRYGESLAGQVRLDEAEAALLEAHAMLAGTLGTHHKRAKETAAAIAAFYADRRGDAAAAERWRRRSR